MRETAKERFWSKIDIKAPEDCWEFKGTLRNGYGMFWYSGTYVQAHRFAWELHYNRKVPYGMLILHHCDNPKCVNHRHLYCGTQQDNMKDRTVRGRAICTRWMAKQRRINEERKLTERTPANFVQNPNEESLK